jgi:DivIVA domain-containing protein
MAKTGRLTAADVHNVSFRKPPIGRRGYEEEEVDAFLDEVQRTIADLTAELDQARGAVGAGSATGTPMAQAADGQAAVLAELAQVRLRLDRIEAALTAGHANGNPAF